jgi:hypothetical protein
MGDIDLVPGPFMKHPKGIRDIAEWFMSTVSRQDYIHQVFARQTEIALANLAKVYAVVGDVPGVNYICGTDFGTQTSTFCSPKTYKNLYHQDTLQILPFEYHRFSFLFQELPSEKNYRGNSRAFSHLTSRSGSLLSAQPRSSSHFSRSLGLTLMYNMIFPPE